MAKKQEPKEGPAIVTVEGEREKTVALLSQHFAQDNLSLEELEKRMEAVYQAKSVPALRELTRDLMVEAPAPSALAPVGDKAAAVSADYPMEYERITSVMSETKRKGVWQVAKKLNVWSVMSETKLDLTQAILQPGVTEIKINALMASVKVIVPAGVRVVLQAGALMGSVSDETIDPPAVGSGAPVVRITGRVIMSELVARVRRRELPPGDEE